MSMTAIAAYAPRGVRRKDGVIGFVGRMIHRDPEAYEAWLEERDKIIITATLLRLKERQLNRIGLSRATLAFDVEHLVTRAEREAQICSDILRIVDGDMDDDRVQSHAIAAE